MDLNYLRKLLRLVKKAGINEIEIEEEGIKVRICNEAEGRVQTQMITAAPPELMMQQPVAPAAAPTADTAETEPQPDSNLTMIESPMVGTFYRAPAPDAPPFVQKGTSVEAGTVVCIIEAMKVMNEIKAGVAGEIAEIHVENGQPVEFGQPLFSVKP